MNDIVDEMRTYYACRAPVYDASMGYDDPAVVERHAPVIETLRRQLAGRRVLEIACGPGFWTRIVSETATSIVATDCNESVLEEARRKELDPSVVSLRSPTPTTSRPCRRASPSTERSASTGLPTFRCHARTTFLRDCTDRLTPGARVVFCDQLPGPASFTGLFDDEGNHLQERELPDGTRYRVIKHFRSDDDFHDLLAPWTTDVTIERFPDCRRVVVGYTRRLDRDTKADPSLRSG